MQNNILRPLLSGVLIFIVFHSIFAQKEQDIHLLYNTVPVYAKVSDSAEIIKILQVIPDYMTGFKGVSSETVETKTDKPEESNAPSVSTPTFVVSSEYFDVPFRDGYAILDDEAVKVLDEMIVELKKNPAKGVIISIFNDYVFTNIYKNRVNAIKAYMKIEGITQDRIKLNYLEGTSDQNKLKVHFTE